MQRVQDEMVCVYLTGREGLPHKVCGMPSKLRVMTDSKLARRASANTKNLSMFSTRDVLL